MSLNPDKPLFMVAQLPFNTQETVTLNTPMIKIMDDSGNVKIAVQNLKELKIYKGLYHELFNEEEREKVFQDMEKWIDERV